MKDGKAWRVPLVANEKPKNGEEVAKQYAEAIDKLPAALASAVTAAASMRYKVGQEHYILTEPENGTWSFWRQWPGESSYDIAVPDGVRVATDGNVALQRILINPRECRILMDYAPYLQMDRDGNPIKDRAKALLVFGMAKAPAVTLHGRKYEGALESVTIDGKPAFLIPLFGEDPAKVKDGIEKRYADAMAALPAK